MKANGVMAEVVAWPLDEERPNAIDLIDSGDIDRVLNIPKSIEKEELTNDYLIRRHTVDRGIPLLVNAETAALFAQAIHSYRLEDLRIRAWDDYVPPTDAIGTEGTRTG